MKLTRSFLATNLIFSLVFISFLTIAISSVSAQDTKIALQRGYRTGYSDGYMAGYRDAIENATKSYARHNEYRAADRAYSEDYGKVIDYKDGYQQGFETGYDTGFTKQSFDATIPATLNQRGYAAVNQPVENVKTTANTTPKPNITQRLPVENNVAVTKPPVNTTADTTIKTPVTKTPAKTEDPDYSYSNDASIADIKVQNNNNNTGSIADIKIPDDDVVADTDITDSTDVYSPKPIDNSNPNISTRTKPQRSRPTNNDIIIIPTDTELIIELLDGIDTERVREGDVFKARVVSPNEINGAIIEGRVAKNRRPGRIKRRGELLLSFDRIVLENDRWSNFNAIIVEVLPVKGDNVKRVDQEGIVEGQRPYKKDGLTVGGATVGGLVIGAIAGGPVGAAVGAGVGAAFGVGAIIVERGEYIQLQQQQQLRIKTAYETQIR